MPDAAVPVPASSVAVQVTVVVPSGKKLPLEGRQTTLVITPQWLKAAGGGMQHATLAYHWARMIEAVHAAWEAYDEFLKRVKELQVVGLA